MDWQLLVYRKLCETDIASKLDGHHGLKRFEYLLGPEPELRQKLDSLKQSDQIIAIELHDQNGNVAERHDNLTELASLLNTTKECTDYWPVIEAVIENKILNKILNKTLDNHT